MTNEWDPLDGLDPNSPTLKAEAWRAATTIVADNPLCQPWVNAARVLLAGALITIIKRRDDHDPVRLAD